MGESYDPGGEIDLGGFAASMTAYGALVAGLGFALRTSEHQLPPTYSVGDILLGGVATHKLSRLLAKGSVTSPLRAPFTEFVESAGSSEHHESPRGDHGVRHTVGELLSCPFCLGVWLGTAYVAGLAVTPRRTRTVAAVFAVVGVSDALQQAYSWLRTD